MIRFACPGCDAAFTVSDEKAGKTGKCPKCATQFVIPGTAAGGEPFPPPPPVMPSVPPTQPIVPPPNDDVEIAPCPGCQKRLTVAVEDLGQTVECPFCQAVYTAERLGGTPPTSSRKKPGSLSDALSDMGPRRRDRDDEPRSRRPRGDEASDDDRPSRRRRSDEAEEEPRPSRRRAIDAIDEDRPSRRSRSDEAEDADDERPRRRRRDEDDDDRPRKRRRRRYEEPHRGGLILGLGLVGCLCCGLAALAGAIMGGVDLGKMSRGEMDESGRTMTIIGMVFGILGTVLWAANVFLRAAAVMGK